MGEICDAERGREVIKTHVQEHFSDDDDDDDDEIDFYSWRDADRGDLALGLDEGVARSNGYDFCCLDVDGGREGEGEGKCRSVFRYVAVLKA